MSKTAQIHAIPITNQKDAVVDYIDDLLVSKSTAHSQPQSEPQNTIRPDQLHVAAQTSELDTNRCVQKNVLSYVILTIGNLRLGLPKSQIKCSLVNEQLQIATPNTRSNASHAVLGRLQYQGQDIEVADVAAMVLPERQFNQLSNEPRKSNWIVLLRDANLAILSDSEPQDIQIEQEQIQWRSAAGTRLWLAGTVACVKLALLDVAELLDWVKSKR